MSIEQSTIDHILSMAKEIKSGLEFKLKKLPYEFHLHVIDENRDKFPIMLPYALMNDFDEAIKKDEHSSYYYTIESRLKFEICLGLVDNEIYPNIIVSDEMINEKGEWWDPLRSLQTFNVSFGEKMAKYLADGFQFINNCLKDILDMSPLYLDDIKKHQKRLKELQEHYLKHKNFNESEASIESLQYLKAGAVGKIIELEKIKNEGTITRIKQEIDKEIYYIVGQLCANLPIGIGPPDFMVSIKELTGASISRKSDTSSITVTTLSQVDHYNVAFSLAHEQHDYVDNVFDEIKRIEPSLKVFYYRDEEQEIKLWGRNMIPLLQKIYRDQTDHVIIFVSNEYVKKRWARHEWQSVQEAILDREEEYLLPARFDDSELEGLYITINYIDLRKKTPKDFAKMIVAKVKSLKT